MTDFRPIFGRLGLQQYIDTFADEGFENWETILEITESDLDALKVKLGHRRILQREIAAARGARTDHAALLHSPARSHGTYEISHFGSDEVSETYGPESLSAPRRKRRYRRHPKPDENAPERPPSAYVVFSNKLRDDLKPQNLSFTDIAKRVGESWQMLSAEEKELYESQASTAKEKYHREMTNYKATEKYREYQKYLADFKAKHGSHTEDGQPRLDHELSTASSTSIGSGNEGTNLALNSMESHRRRFEGPNLIAPPSTSEARYSLGATLSRPSSIPITSPAKDSSVSVSPPQPLHLGSSTVHRPAGADFHQERALPLGSAPSMMPSPFARESYSPSGHGIPPYDAKFPQPQPRRSPVRPVDQLPSFRHQGSSKSSVTSSQSSVSTAATSLSTLRTSDDDKTQQLILPPLSAVTSVRADPFTPRDEDTPSSISSASVVVQPTVRSSAMSPSDLATRRDPVHHARLSDIMQEIPPKAQHNFSSPHQAREQAVDPAKRRNSADALSVLADVANTNSAFRRPS